MYDLAKILRIVVRSGFYGFYCIINKHLSFETWPDERHNTSEMSNSGVK